MGRGAWWAIVHVAAKRHDQMAEDTLVCNTKNFVVFFFYYKTILFFACDDVSSCWSYLVSNMKLTPWGRKQQWLWTEPHYGNISRVGSYTVLSHLISQN